MLQHYASSKIYGLQKINNILIDLVITYFQIINTSKSNVMILSFKSRIHNNAHYRIKYFVLDLVTARHRRPN